MKELLEHLARGLVERPEAVRVTELQENDGSTLLELAVADDDYGKVIGRGGRTAAALRAVVKFAAARNDRRVFVDIVDAA
ncbi:MAG: KH domain-containing protein [Solirubrobacteraceae bacterium]